MNYYIDAYQLKALKEVLNVLITDDGTPMHKLAGDKRRDLANRMWALLKRIEEQQL